jgi:RNA polymerase sigma-70 factor (ECF subfamily)
MSEAPAPEKPAQPTFAVQATVRTPWRAFIDEIAPLRPDLHRYCCGLTGNVWDGEDLLQDTLLRVFGLLGKINADLQHPRAYLIRAATHLWIDRMRGAGVERAHAQGVAAEADARPSASTDASQGAAVRDAACELFLHLAPQERAAVLLKDVLDFSLEETAAMLKTTVGAIKAALHRGRTRLQQAKAQDSKPALVPRELVDRFVAALTARDIDGIRAMCLADVTVEHVGGATAETFEQGKMTLEFAHLVLPQLRMGTNPRWQTVLYRGEPIAIGLRTVDGVEGLNEVWRLEAGEHGIERIRLYCFCPDLLVTVARDLGLPPLKRPYRSW